MKTQSSALSVVWPALLVVASACGGRKGDDAVGIADAGSRLDAPIHPSGPCGIVIDAPPFQVGLHVPIGTDVQWDSNPPSSGSHYPYWARFRTYSEPVDRRYYVHNLEHGGLALLYRCDDPAGCPDVVAAFESVRDQLAADPLCLREPNVRVRVVITPDPLLEAPIAAATWGWTYNAECLDLPSLIDFANAHYAQDEPGTERICTDGTDPPP